MVFENREQAGKKLANKLLRYRKESTFVLALPRGGVPVGFEVAEVLQAPLDVLVVRKIGLSGNKEFGIGAIAEGGVQVLDFAGIESSATNEEELKDVISSEEEELKRRVRIYRGGVPLPDLKGKTVILVDDGIARGITVKAGIEAAKKLNPKKIILAIPVCASDTLESLKRMVDDIVCLATPVKFMAVGSWYKNFAQISDEEVVKLLNKNRENE
ncbi:phosphoribosyltransferase [Candidatus Daviesbacteria bacterium]|nr:phosphoribosyltransferase [Candidatus Daviesbacteria bacterium]